MNVKTSKPLFPGKQIKTDLDVVITVYPLGVTHIKRFTEDITRIVNASQSIRVSKNADKKQVAEQFVMGLIPLVLTDALELVKECTKVEGADFDELPHWLLPDIASAWIEESFGEEKKWRPWVTLIESTISRVTKQTFSISEIWSKASSQQATDSNQSLIDNNEESPT